MIDPVLLTYARTNLEFESGDGPCLFTTAGEKDISSLVQEPAVNALGYAHSALIAALTEQSGKVWHLSNIYKIPGQEKFTRQLIDVTFADTVFFTNSGAEALECAIKMAQKYHHFSGISRYELTTFVGTFHVRTLAAIAAGGGNKKHLEDFGPMMLGFIQVAFGNVKEVDKAIGPNTAGVLIEPVQGEGGIRVLLSKDLQSIRELNEVHIDEAIEKLDRACTALAAPAENAA